MKNNNELDKKARNDQDDFVLEMMNSTTLFPMREEASIGVSNYTPVRFSQLAAYGVAFEPLMTAVQSAINGVGGSGFYYVDTAGKTMFQMKETGNFIGSLQTIGGMVGGGQAQMIPLACNPTMIFMAAVLSNIEKKLDTICDMQQEMMDFLVQKEKSELKGNLVFLFDVFNHYKYNWDNEKYKKGNYIKVLDIRHEIEKKIIFYRDQIATRVNKKSLIHGDKGADKKLQEVQDLFKDYQLALYILSLSSFLEVILLENYESEYLTGISNKLSDYSVSYRELYTDCYDAIEEYLNTSVQSSLAKGAAKVSTLIGKNIEKIPVIGDTQADETMINVGNKLNEWNDGKNREQMMKLIERQSNFVRPFVENINTINELYNRPIELILDDENIYLATV